MRFTREDISGKSAFWTEIVLSWHLLLHRVYNRDNLLVLTFPACPLLMYVPVKKCKMVSVFT